MSEIKQWIVTASGERPLREVAKSLTENGFVVAQVLEEIGCVIGTADDNQIKQIRAIPGVTDVSPEAAINLGPPDAPITY